MVFCCFGKHSGSGSEPEQKLAPIETKDDQTFFLRNDTHDLVARHHGGSLDIVDKSGSFVKNLYYRAEEDKGSYFPAMQLTLQGNHLVYGTKEKIYARICLDSQSTTVSLESMLERLMAIDVPV